MKIIRNIVFIVLVILTLLAILFKSRINEWANEAGPTAMILVIVVGAAGVVLMFWVGSERDWQKIVGNTLARLEGDSAQATFEELKQKWARGRKFWDTALLLSVAYAIFGEGGQAEKMAREAWTIAKKEGYIKRRTAPDRIRTEYTVLALYDAIATQGRFEEAAQGLIKMVPHSEDPEYMGAYIAWYYLLAGNEATARNALREFFPTLADSDLELKIAEPMMQLRLYYMAHKLLGVNARRAMAERRDHLARLERFARRAAGSPQSVRSIELYNEMRAVLGMPRLSA